MSEGVDELREELNAKLDEVKELQQEIRETKQRHRQTPRSAPRQTPDPEMSEEYPANPADVGAEDGLDMEFVVILAFVAVIMIAYMALVM